MGEAEVFHTFGLPHALSALAIASKQLIPMEDAHI